MKYFYLRRFAIFWVAFQTWHGDSYKRCRKLCKQRSQEMTFHPRTLSQSPIRDQKPEDILIQKGLRTKEKIEILRAQFNQTPSFKPQINPSMGFKHLENVTPSPQEPRSRFDMLYEDANHRQHKGEPKKYSFHPQLVSKPYAL